MTGNANSPTSLLGCEKLVNTKLRNCKHADRLEERVNQVGR